MGCADITPCAGVDWVGCGVDDDILSAVDQAEDGGRSADGTFGDGDVVYRFIGAVCYVLYKYKIMNKIIKIDAL